MSVDYFALALSNFDPWWMIAFSLILILVDWTIVQTEALMTVGLAVFFAALLNAVDAAPVAQLWSLPLFAFVAYLVQRPIYSRLASKEKPPYEPLENEVGADGTLVVRYTSETAASHYFKYKENIYLETAPQEKVTFVCKVSMKSGQVFPAITQEGMLVKDGLSVRVIGIQNGALIVKPL